MITYRATLDVPCENLRAVTGWLREHRRAHDARPPGSEPRPCTSNVQAVVALRWFKDATDIRLLAGDAAVSIATGHRYLHETIDVTAAH